MPLKSGKKNMGSNIKELMAHGHSQKKSVAIAYKVAGKSTRPDNKFYGHLDGGQKGEEIYGGINGENC